MRADGLLRAAVANNAGWCDAVCRSHGYPGEFTARTWISLRHDLPFYPNAITLSPQATAADTQAARDPGRAYAVKDSFARLDLAPEGLAPLFDADWVAWDPAPRERPPADGLRWEAVSDAAELARWEAAWAAAPDAAGLFRPDLLADPCCAVLGCYRDGVLAGGAIAYTAAQVTGISNVFKTGLPGEIAARAGRCGAAPCVPWPRCGPACPSSATRAARTWPRPGRPAAGSSGRCASGPAGQPFRSWATIASACSRVSPLARLGMGSTRLPPARKTTWSLRQPRRSG